MPHPTRNGLSLQQLMKKTPPPKNFFYTDGIHLSIVDDPPRQNRTIAEHFFWQTAVVFVIIEQAKSAEVSATKRRTREQDLEPTERDYDGNNNAEDGTGTTGGSAGGKGKGGGEGGGKKRQRDAPAKSSQRGEDLDRLKKSFLGGSKAGTRGDGGKRAASSAEDFVQPKKKGI